MSCHDSKNSHTLRFFFKHNQQDGEEYSDRLLEKHQEEQKVYHHGLPYCSELK